MDTYTTTTRNSYGSRLANALKGLIIGPILIVLAIWLLWYNEGRAVERTRDLNAGEKTVMSLSSPSYDAKNDNLLVHTTGELTSGTITDSDFGVTVTGSVLERKVEIYQWEETKKETVRDNIGGSQEVVTTYSYNLVWSENPINSKNFQKNAEYQNPQSMPYNSDTKIYSDLKLGDFTFSDDLVSQLAANQKVSLANTPFQKEGYEIQGDYIMSSGSTIAPKLGDIRISYSYLPEKTLVSVLAAQKAGNILDSYEAKNSEIARIVIGTQSAEEMFQMLQSENKILTWILRVLGFFVMYIGWSAFFSILPILAAVVPFLKTIVGFGTGIIAFILSILLSGTVIIIAWIFVRPLIAVLVLLLMVGVIYASFQYKKKKGASISEPLSPPSTSL